MKELLECFTAWLQSDPQSNMAWKIMDALAREARKVAESPDPEQREFNALELADVCKPGECLDYDSAKRWFANAKCDLFLSSRRISMEAFFTAHGHTNCLVLDKRPSSGHHKTTWYLRAYQISVEREMEDIDTPALEPTGLDSGRFLNIVYTATKPGEIKLSLLGRLVLGNGAFRTKSWRGVMWATAMAFYAVIFLACGYLIFQMIKVNRAIQTSDLILIMTIFAIAWFIWRLLLRPLVWLLEDRIGFVSDAFIKFKELPAHLDMAKDGEHRYIRLVRYEAVCPVCAGSVELRYGHGPNYRRIFGCCTEVPTEHVFTFDRVTKQGQRYQQ